MATTKIVAAAEPPNLQGPEARGEPNSLAHTSGTTKDSTRDAGTSDAVQNVGSAEPPLSAERNSSAHTIGTTEDSTRDAGSSDAVQSVGSPEPPLSAVDTSAVVVQEKGACASKEKGQRSEEEANEQKGAGSPTPAGYTACVISSSLPALPPTTVVKPKDLEYQGPTDESK